MTIAAFETGRRIFKFQLSSFSVFNLGVQSWLVLSSLIELLDLAAPKHTNIYTDWVFGVFGTPLIFLAIGVFSIHAELRAAKLQGRFSVTREPQVDAEAKHQA